MMTRPQINGVVKTLNLPEMSNLTLHQIEIKHLPHVLTLQEQAFSADLLEPLSLFEEMLRDSPKTHFIVMDVGKPAGYCFAHPTFKICRDFEKGCGILMGEEDAYYLHDLCVSPDYRGQGVAKILYEAQYKKAKSMGFDMMSGVAVQGSMPFWEKLGFSKREPYVYMGADGFYMTCELA